MKISINIPKEWDELTDRQLDQLALLFHSGKKGVAMDVRVFYILLAIRPWQLIRLARFYIVINQVPMSDLRSHFEFIYNSTGRTKFPANVWNNKKQKFFPPLDDIENLTAEEFAIADDLHIKFRETGDIEYLQMLTAVLYVTNEIRRPEFFRESLPFLSDCFAAVPQERLLSVELTYAGCRASIVKRFPKAFPKSGKKPKSGPAYGFAKVILTMCKGDLSKHQAHRRTNIYTFLEQFQEDLINAKNEKHGRK